MFKKLSSRWKAGVLAVLTLTVLSGCIVLPHDHHDHDKRGHYDRYDGHDHRHDRGRH